MDTDKVVEELVRASRIVRLAKQGAFDEDDVDLVEKLVERIKADLEEIVERVTPNFWD